MKIFLGGTYSSSWRDKLITFLENHNIEYFNPVVSDWTEECQKEEIKQRNECDFVLYVITPRMTGVYSIAEAVDDSNKRPSKTLFYCMVYDDRFTFNAGQIKSLISVSNMITKNGGKVFMLLENLYDWLKIADKELQA